MNKKIIEIQKINKFYGSKHVLKDISFNIYEGDKIAFIGGNGSGKSTTVEIIAKVKEASSGAIKYDANLIIGIQFQESNYPVGITVKALINFYLDRYKTSLSMQQLNMMLTTFRLATLYKKQIIEMSGGQKQRLNILLALIHSPNLLILDELSTGLDIKVRRELREYIMKYLRERPKTSLILITHSMNEAQELANRVIVLDWGKITYDMPLSEIIKKYKSLAKFADEIFDKMYQDNIVKRKENK